MISLFLSRVLGILRDSVMSHQFGIGAETDAYRLAFQVPDLLFYLVAGGALSSAFIPVFSEYLHTDRDEDAWRVFGSVVTIMSTALLIFIVTTFIFAYPIAQLLAPGKPELWEQIAQMSRILVPAQFAFFIGGLMIGTLYARQRFAVPGLGPNLYNLGIIFGAIVISRFVSPSIAGMAWGALIGAFLGNIVVPFFAMRALRSRFSVVFDFKHPGVKKVFVLMAPVVLGLSLPGVYGMIIQYFGSYYQAGVNTSLDLSNKLMQSPVGVFGQSMALAAFPALSQFFAQGKMDAFRNQLGRTLRTVVFLSIPVAIFFAVLAGPVTVALFSYGKGKNADISLVATYLQIYSIGLVGWCMHPVLMRAYYATQNTLKPVVTGTVTTAVFIGLIFGLRITPLDHLALPLASSIAAIGLATVLVLMVSKDTGGIEAKSLLRTIVCCLIASAPMAAILVAGDWLLPLGIGNLKNLWAAIRVVILGLIGAWAFYLTARALKMQETDTIDRAMAKLTKRQQTAAQDKAAAPPESGP